MGLTAEIIDKKITETACQALGLIRNTAREIDKEGEYVYMYKILTILCKLYSPGAEIKN